MSANSFVLVPRQEVDPNNPDSDSKSIRYDSFVALLFKLQTPNEMLMHAALGICGEAGELADAIKKHVIYGKPMDYNNVLEELGDLRFYMQALQNLLAITEQRILQNNADKLSVRYKQLTYSDNAAISRADKA